MQRNLENQNNIVQRGLSYIFTIFVFVVVAFSFPYLLDDWAWGGQVGMDRFNSNFANYNGRYLGNYVVLLLTRSTILKAVTIAGVTFLILYLGYKFVNKKRLILYPFMMICLFVMQRDVFRQTLAWTSGFSNYVVPTLLLIAYFYVIRAVFDNRAIIKKRYIPLCLALGVSTALFMENVTICQVILDIYLLVFILIKYKKTSLSVIGHLIGSAVGAYIMFSNSSYASIMSNKDDYRTMATSNPDGIVGQAVENFNTVIYKGLAFDNKVLLVIICLLAIALVAKFFHDEFYIYPSRKTAAIVPLVIICIYTVYAVVCRFLPNWHIFGDYTDGFNSIFTIVYCFMLLFICCACVTRKEVLSRLIFELVTVACLTAPLMVVTPVSGRCFFIGYVIFVIFAVELFNYVTDSFRFDSVRVATRRNRRVSVLLTLVVVLIGVFYSYVYISIGISDIQRTLYIENQVTDGKSEIIIPRLPYEDFLWSSVPAKNTFWEWRYKDFCDIDQNKTLKIITYDEWKEITGNNKAGK